MPFKRNPILCERIDSLARLLVGFSDVAWQNAATNYLERTLDDSANRRTILPEAFLCADEIVSLASRVIGGLRVNERRMAHNLRTYGPFAGTEAVMMEAVRSGGDRQQLHETIRGAAMQAWDALARGEDNPLSQLLAQDRELTSRMDPAEIRRLLDPGKHVGTAPQRALLLADRIDRMEPFPKQDEVPLNV
jgi:adenylosuccinate lyase